MTICSVVSLSAMVLTYKMSKTTSNITKTCNKCTNFIKTIKATTQFVVFLFVHSWEQRKFEDFFTERNERSGNGEMISVTIGSGIKKFDELNRFDKKPDDLSKYKRVEVGDIAYNSMRMWQGASGYSPYSGILSPAYTVITPKNGVSSRFFAYVLKQPKMIHQFEINSQGLTKDTWNLKFPAFAPIEVVAPLQLAEQEKVSELLLQLDNLITLHQREFFRLISAFFCCNSTSILPISWEQRKLGELVDVCSGRDYKHLSEGTIPVYGTGGYMLSVNDALSYDRDAIGIGRKGTIDRPYILKAPFWTVDTLFYAIPREKADLNFAFDIFQNIDWKKKDESTGVPSLSKTAINDIDVLAPKHGEQQTIGQFFAAIDHLITLHQCECLYKTRSLASWFCRQTNRKTTSFWEQRKLGDTVQITMGQSPDGSTYSDVPSNYILVQGNADLQNGWVSPRVWTSQMTKKADAGDLIMSVRAPAGAMGKTAYNAVIGRGVAAIKGNEFIYQLLVKMDSDGYWKALSCGSTFESLNSDNIKNADVLIPDTDEQEKIGQYFANLDHLITLHQRIKINITGDYHDKKDK